MRRYLPLAVLATTAVLGLTACSSSDNAPSGSNRPPASAAPTESVAGPTAEEATKALAAKIPTMKLTVVYDEDTDPNKRLGRPHQYVGKTAFADSRVDTAAANEAADGDTHSIDYGGTVETFATEAAATTWVKYVEDMSKALGGFVTPEYVYRNGATVVRVSSHLKPSDARDYETAVQQL
ncbi:hypothetical protein GL263_15175 [Streptomyces durbertensis]|uniref:Lipoprotein n=1 Tax=Streptomyces durbertensis TaxID=2448886 RepID=A0ABR6EHS7_9ACTN|nr:hypothetical protein [Streptomyces durbertensis]MBB1244897.1 hypothetical protein [Streptomyces durbertensis]